MTQGRASPWTARDDELIARWNADESTGAIAEAMGIPSRQIEYRVYTLRRRGVPLARRDVEHLRAVARQRRATSPHIQPTSWPPKRDAKLRELWDAGLRTSEIAERLGTTKNAVVGRAHRLCLKPRPSPIKHRDLYERRPKGTKNGAPRAPKVTLTDLPSQNLHEPMQASPESAPAPPPVTHPVYVPPAPYARITECCWPIGDPGCRGFRFCDAPSAPGRPYCFDHCGRAYLRVRDRGTPAESDGLCGDADRREDAARA